MAKATQHVRPAAPAPTPPRPKPQPQPRINKSVPPVEAAPTPPAPVPPRPKPRPKLKNSVAPVDGKAPLPPPPHSNQYQAVPLPPPPQRNPLSTIPEVPEDGNPRTTTTSATTATTSVTATATSATSASASTSTKDVGGRPNSDQVDLMSRFVKQTHKQAAEYAARCGLSPERFLAALMRAQPKAPRTQNGWNAYEGFAHTLEHRVKELRRIQPDYDPDTTPFPTLSGQEISAMYKLFQEAHPDGEAERILEKFSQVSMLEQEETMQDRQRQFQKICKSLRALVRRFCIYLIDTDLICLEQIDNANDSDFEAILFICGSYVNEDSELAQVIATPALQDAVRASFQYFFPST